MPAFMRVNALVFSLCATVVTLLGLAGCGSGPGCCRACCGSNCRYDCHDVDRCGVRAGPASIITCTSVTTCAVECQGSCQVICNDAKSCDLTCLTGPPATSCADGTVRCGSC